MSCPVCVKNHIIPEAMYVCNCSCHSWGGIERIALSPPMSNLDISTIGVKEYHFSIDELKVLAKCLETQYLAYDNEPLHEVVNRIFKIIKEHDNIS